MLDKNKIISSIPTVVIGLALAAVFAVIAVIGMPQRAQAAPFECNAAFYQVINGGLRELDPVTGEYITLGSTGSLQTNGIGYNILDDFIYGIRPDSEGDPELVRIEIEAGVVVTTSLGLPAGYDTDVGSVAGDFDHSGNLYLYSSAGSNTVMNIVNVAANTATQVTLSQPAAVNDLVFVDGLLYGTNGTTLFEIDPSTGGVTTKPLGLASGVYGAGWAADDSKLFFAHNTSGLIYEIFDFANPSPNTAIVLEGDTSFGNDGASCSLAQSPIPPFFATDDSGQTQAGVPVLGNMLTNDSGRELTVTDHTQPTNGTVVVNPDGSYTYTPNPGFVGTDTFTYTVTDEYGETRTATVTITVSPAGEIEESTLPEDDELAATGISQPTLLWGASVFVMVIGLAIAYKVHGSIRS